ncbi:unnamed protein product [Hermetia illucens]|uniref:Envelope protein n=1 Tax=Hermetia illucens TaxID=343691 RepID=A0A7R8V309_HERIL|nr:unnamed protein product [Hermetia illucens]
MALLILFSSINPAKGLLNIHEIKEQTGFAEIQLDKTDIVSKTSIILHVMNTTEILDLITDFRTNAENLDGQYRDLILTELRHLTNKVRTLIPQETRHKRGLINLVGNTQKWLFGTMDAQDRQDIDDHLKTLDLNTHNLITTINQQVEINKNYSETFKQLKEIVKRDREIILNRINNLSMANNHFYDQMFKIQIIKSILTDEEIQKYEINLNKLAYVKVGVAKSENNLLLFAIKIPKEYITVQLKMVIPVPNDQNKEIDYPNEIVFSLNNSVYKYEKLKYLNELSIKILELDTETILIKNAKQLEIIQNCDSRKLILSGNQLLHFSNCQVKILDHYFSNIKEKSQDRFFYPTNQINQNFTDKLTLDDIILYNAENIHKIEELQVHRKITYVLSSPNNHYTNNTTNLQIIMALLILFSSINPAKGLLNIHEIKEQTGFAEIQLDKTDIVSKTSIILHVMNTTEILDLITDFRTNAENLDGQYRDLILTELRHLTNKVRTLIPQETRHKRGLINLVGNTQKWLFGTMDAQDRQDIDDHLKTLDLNTHNLITTINQQVEINKNYSETFKQLKEIVKRDREIILNRINNLSMANNHFYDQMFKIQIIKSILTDEEIQKYEINLNKLAYVKVGVAKSENNLLLFAIKIPKEYITVQLKMVIPVPNDQNKEIDYPNEIVFSLNNSVYKYEKLKYLNELSIKILELDTETILIKNAKQLEIIQNCDSRKLILSGNQLLHFSNCQVKILDHYFSNIKEKSQDRFFYPTNQINQNFTDKLTLDDIILYNAENIHKIEELQVHRKITYGSMTTKRWEDTINFRMPDDGQINASKRKLRKC